MLWYISTYIKASAFKILFLPSLLLQAYLKGSSWEERGGRVTRVDWTKWNFPGSADRLAVPSGAESCSVWAKWNSKSNHHELFMSFPIPISSCDAAVAQMTLSKVPIGQPKNLRWQQPTFPFLSKQRVGKGKENEKKENVTAAQSVGAQRHCWLMY